ncbi:MAG TPA: hypothetical protein VHP58_04840 [Alphaproteobacteria bacterium]|nr:hypothetical protein [Alphaproteobacteria bacterium]
MNTLEEYEKKRRQAFADALGWLAAAREHYGVPGLAEQLKGMCSTYNFTLQQLRTGEDEVRKLDREGNRHAAAFGLEGLRRPAPATSRDLCVRMTLYHLQRAGLEPNAIGATRRELQLPPDD